MLVTLACAAALAALTATVPALSRPGAVFSSSHAAGRRNDSSTAARRSTLSAHAASRSSSSHVASRLALSPQSGRGAATARPAGSGRPLAGKIVGIDPGHNGRNYSDPSYIDHLVWNGREMEGCDTTGTETDFGYTEAEFNFNVATHLASDLRVLGAKVVMTRNSNSGVGPCVNKRAEILDRAQANVAIDIHADGGPPSGRGFAVLEPVADGRNDHVIAASKRFAGDVLRRYEAVTGMPASDYDGRDGISLRDDLAGLNLTTVPKVLIECGNMRNATDASLLAQPRFQRLAARALSEAIAEYLGTRR